MMPTHQSRTRRLTIVGIAVSLSLYLGGCTTSDENPKPTPSNTATSTPSPTPTPSLDPEEAAKQENIDAAKLAFTEFIAKTNEVQKAGMLGWEALLSFIGSAELRAERQNYYRQTVEQGLVQTGDTVVASLTVSEYVPDPTGLGAEQVRLDACLDNTSLDLVNPQGASVLLPGYPPRLISEVLMQHQADGRWTVDATKTNEDRPC